MSKFAQAAAVLVLSSLAWHANAQEFPPGAAPLSAGDLQKRMAGKVFDVKISNGADWRFELKENGYFFIYVSVNGGYSDTGEWKAEDGKLCTSPRKGRSGCNEMRADGEALFMKRDNGDIVQFVAR
jgi:hypothetical protein